MVRHQIVMQRAELELTLTLLDQKLIIHGGDTRLEQEFPSAAALVEHALRVVKLRQQDGYRVIAERKDDQIVMPPEPKTETEDKGDKAEKLAKPTVASAEPRVRKAAAKVTAKPAAAAPVAPPPSKLDALADDDDEDDDDDDDDDDEDGDAMGEEPVDKI